MFEKRTLEEVTLDAQKLKKFELKELIKTLQTYIEGVDEVQEWHNERAREQNRVRREQANLA